MVHKVSQSTVTLFEEIRWQKVEQVENKVSQSIVILLEETRWQKPIIQSVTKTELKLKSKSSGPLDFHPNQILKFNPKSNPINHSKGSKS